MTTGMEKKKKRHHCMGSVLFPDLVVAYMDYPICGNTLNNLCDFLYMCFSQ